ncbi:hypothetical protein ACVJBD_002434 [Rhizobium mongolense]
MTLCKNIPKRESRPLLAAAASKAKEDGRKFKAFNWHAIRHFVISTWIEAGIKPKTAGRRRSLLTGRHDEPLWPDVSKRPVENWIRFRPLFSAVGTNGA